MSFSFLCEHEMKKRFVKTLLSMGQLLSSNNTSSGKDEGVSEFGYPKGPKCVNTLFSKSFINRGQ